MTTPTPLEILKAIDGILADVPGGRAYHVQLQQLVQVIAVALRKAQEPAPPATPAPAEAPPTDPP